MPNQSFRTVKVIYFDREKVWSDLQKLVKKMGHNFPEIEKIILFGSLAWGGVAPGSDVDLILILKESTLSFLDRMPKYMPEKFPVGIDIFPYTQEEVERMIKNGNLSLKRALEKGIVLFNREVNIDAS